MKTMVSLQVLFGLLCVVIISLAVTTAVGVTTRKQVIKQPCSYDRDCPRYAFCQGQKECACKEGFFIHKEENRNEICLKRVQTAGDPCVDDAQCQLALGPSAECRRDFFQEHDYTCACREYAHLVDDRCYNTSRVGEKCLSKNNCVMEGGPALSCVNDVCICPRNQHANADRTKCIDDRRLGEDCFEDEECVAPNSYCTEICECRIHYVVNQWNRACIPVADSVDDPCEEEQQCRFIPFSQCYGDPPACVCLDGYHPGPKGATCYRDARLGEDCENEWECIAVPTPLEVPYNTTRAECHKNKCRCAEGYHPSSKGRFCDENMAEKTSQVSALLLIAAVSMSFFRA